jgi:hypothetical protein
MNPPLYCGSGCLEGRTYACDGPEDCTNGDDCCNDGNGSHCQQTGTCSSTLCHQDAECPSSAPRCCPLTSTTQLDFEFGQCMAAGSC